MLSYLIGPLFQLVGIGQSQGNQRGILALLGGGGAHSLF